MKNNLITISMFLMAIILFSTSGVQASALGQLEQQASGQNCFDEGCSGVAGDGSGNNQVPGSNTQYSYLNDFWTQLRAGGANFVANIPTLMNSLKEPLFRGLLGK